MFSLSSRSWARLGPLVALVFIGFVFSCLSNSFLTAENLKSIVEAAAVPAILAAGISFVILLGSIDLSVEGVIATSSMLVALLVSNGINGNDFGVWGIAIALAAGSLIGGLNGLLNAFLRMPSLIVTLGTWFIGLGLAAVLFPERIPVIHEALVLDVSRVRPFGLSLAVYIALLVVFLSHLVLNFTSIGRMICAIGGDEAVVVGSGIPVRRYKVAAYVISGTLAALGGLILSGQLGNGNADIGNGQLFPAISAAVVGGTVLSGGRGGAIQSALGAITLEALSNGLIHIGAGPYSRNIISGAVILIAVAASSWHLRRKLRVVK